MKDEECLCEMPHLEWCLTPLGAPVELSWSSANHHLCLGSEQLRRDLLPHAHRGIAAEALYAAGEVSAFIALVL